MIHKNSVSCKYPYNSQAKECVDYFKILQWLLEYFSHTFVSNFPQNLFLLQVDMRALKVLASHFLKKIFQFVFPSVQMGITP
jgi:hypothetical protein